MKSYLYKKLKEVHLGLEAIDMDSSEVSIETSLSMLHFLENSLSEIKTFFLSQNNLRKEDEICFFKK